MSTESLRHHNTYRRQRSSRRYDSSHHTHEQCRRPPPPRYQTPPFNPRELLDAISMRRRETVKHLLQTLPASSANLDTRLLLQAAFLRCVEHGDERMLQLLWDRGDWEEHNMLMQARVPEIYQTPLHVAARWGRIASVRFLLNCDVPCPWDEPDSQGMTPLMLAAIGGHVNTCSLLLTKGVRPLNANQLTGHSALCYAILTNHWRLGNFLLYACNKHYRHALEQYMEHSVLRIWVTVDGRRIVDKNSFCECLKIVSFLGRTTSCKLYMLNQVCVLHHLRVILDADELCGCLLQQLVFTCLNLLYEHDHPDGKTLVSSVAVRSFLRNKWLAMCLERIAQYFEDVNDRLLGLCVLHCLIPVFVQAEADALAELPLREQKMQIEYLFRALPIYPWFMTSGIATLPDNTTKQRIEQSWWRFQQTVYPTLKHRAEVFGYPVNELHAIAIHIDVFTLPTQEYMCPCLQLESAVKQAYQPLPPPPVLSPGMMSFVPNQIQMIKSIEGLTIPPPQTMRPILMSSMLQSSVLEASVNLVPIRFDMSFVPTSYHQSVNMNVRRQLPICEDASVIADHPLHVMPLVRSHNELVTDRMPTYVSYRRNRSNSPPPLRRSMSSDSLVVSSLHHSPRRYSLSMAKLNVPPAAIARRSPTCNTGPLETYMTYKEDDDLTDCSVTAMVLSDQEVSVVEMDERCGCHDSNGGDVYQIILPFNDHNAPLAPLIDLPTLLKEKNIDIAYTFGDWDNRATAGFDVAAERPDEQMSEKQGECTSSSDEQASEQLGSSTSIHSDEEFTKSSLSNCNFNDQAATLDERQNYARQFSGTEGTCFKDNVYAARYYLQTYLRMHLSIVQNKDPTDRSRQFGFDSLGFSGRSSNDWRITESYLQQETVKRVQQKQEQCRVHCQMLDAALEAESLDRQPVFPLASDAEHATNGFLQSSQRTSPVLSIESVATASTGHVSSFRQPPLQAVVCTRWHYLYERLIQLGDRGYYRLESVYMPTTEFEKEFIIGQRNGTKMLLALVKQVGMAIKGVVVKTFSRSSTADYCVKRLADFVKFKQLHSSHLLPYRLTLESKDNWYLVRDICDYNLDEYLETLPLGIASFGETQRLFNEMMRGLHFLHSRQPPLFHGNLKPSNVLVDSTRTLRLADFGFGKLFTPPHNYSMYCIDPTGSQMDARCWKPVEYYKPEVPYNCRSDIHAIAMIAYYTFTRGQCHPFISGKNCTVRELQECVMQQDHDLSQVDDLAQHVLGQMLHCKAELRPSSGEVLAHPFFWTADKQCQFLLSVAALKDVRERHAASDIYRAFRELPCTSWRQGVGDDVFDYVSATTVPKGSFKDENAIEYLLFLRECHLRKTRKVAPAADVPDHPPSAAHLFLNNMPHYITRASLAQHFVTIYELARKFHKKGQLTLSSYFA